MKKIIAFLLGCLGIRLILALIAKNISKHNLKLSAIPATIIGLSFLFIYLFDLRKSGFEAGGKIWWNNMRPIHGLMYICYACYAYKQVDFAWIVLLLDTIIGFIAWLWHYYHK